jgi:hypothetical protein
MVRLTPGEGRRKGFKYDTPAGSSWIEFAQGEGEKGGKGHRRARPTPLRPFPPFQSHPHTAPPVTSPTPFWALQPRHLCRQQPLRGSLFLSAPRACSQCPPSPPPFLCLLPCWASVRRGCGQLFPQGRDPCEHGGRCPFTLAPLAPADPGGGTARLSCRRYRSLHQPPAFCFFLRNQFEGGIKPALSHPRTIPSCLIHVLHGRSV